MISRRRFALQLRCLVVHPNFEMCRALCLDVNLCADGGPNATADSLIKRILAGVTEQCMKGEPAYLPCPEPIVEAYKEALAAESKHNASGTTDPFIGARGCILVVEVERDMLPGEVF